MEPESDRIDMSVLDPSRHATRWNAMAQRVAARGLELQRLRRAVLRRGMTALVFAAAAALLLWFAVPRRDVASRPPPDHHHHAQSSSVDVLGWAMRDMTSNDMLELGVGHAQ
jgi:hypothetical protein